MNIIGIIGWILLALFIIAVVFIVGVGSGIVLSKEGLLQLRDARSKDEFDELIDSAMDRHVSVCKTRDTERFFERIAEKILRNENT